MWLKINLALQGLKDNKLGDVQGQNSQVVFPTAKHTLILPLICEHLPEIITWVSNYNHGSKQHAITHSSTVV